MTVLLEVAVDSVASAVAAEQGGAHRIELSGSLNYGGITPSAGLIAMARKRIALPLHVLVRPRPGDFCYTPDEFEVVKRDILLAKQLGANGVAIGVLTPECLVDVARSRELVELARPMSVTFHRAFDLTADLPATLAHVVSTGAERILTSGGGDSAEHGSTMLARLVAAAAGRITILACGHIREHNVAALIQATGAREVHANLQPPIPIRGNTAEQPSGAGALGASPRLEVVASTVARFLKAAEASVQNP